MCSAALANTIVCLFSIYRELQHSWAVEALLILKRVKAICGNFENIRESLYQQEVGTSMLSGEGTVRFSVAGNIRNARLKLHQATPHCCHEQISMGVEWTPEVPVSRFWPEDEIFFKHKYYKILFRLSSFSSWRDALSKCQLEGKHLPTLSTKCEQQDLIAVVKRAVWYSPILYLYIGLHRQVTKLQQLD